MPLDREHTPMLAVRYRIVAQPDIEQTQALLDRARRACNLADAWGIEFSLQRGIESYELILSGDDCDRSLAALIAADAAPTDIVGDRILERHTNAETPLSGRIRQLAAGAGIRFVDLNA